MDSLQSKFAFVDVDGTAFSVIAFGVPVSESLYASSIHVIEMERFRESFCYRLDWDRLEFIGLNSRKLGIDRAKLEFIQKRDYGLTPSRDVEGRDRRR